MLDEYEKLIQESGLLNERVNYYHFDFHEECEQNSEPMMDYIKQKLYPNHIKQMGIFM